MFLPPSQGHKLACYSLTGAGQRQDSWVRDNDSGSQQLRWFPEFCQVIPVPMVGLLQRETWVLGNSDYLFIYLFSPPPHPFW